MKINKKEKYTTEQKIAIFFGALTVFFLIIGAIFGIPQITMEIQELTKLVLIELILIGLIFIFLFLHVFIF